MPDIALGTKRNQTGILLSHQHPGVYVVWAGSCLPSCPPGMLSYSWVCFSQGAKQGCELCALYLQFQNVPALLLQIPFLLAVLCTEVKLGLSEVGLTLERKSVLLAFP